MFKVGVLSSLLFIGKVVNGFNCCIDATSEADCEAITSGSGCMYIGDDQDALALSSNVLCVTPSWYDCTVNGNCPPPPPVPPVPSDCVLDTCDNTDDTFNVAFVVDESGSVGRTNYVLSLDYFVKKMVKENLNEDSLVSFLSFASGKDRNYLFTDKGGPGNTNREGVLNAIEQEKNNYSGGGTCLGPAIEEIITDFTQDLPNVPAAERGQENILFVVTDGIATCMSSCSTYRQQLRDNGITTYIVGITNGFSDNAVRCLVEDQIQPSDPRYDDSRTAVTDYILTIPKFDKALFFQLQLQLRATVCPPIVFKDETFANKLFVVLTGANDMVNDNLLYVVSLALLMVAGLVYYFRERLCATNEKYVPLVTESHGRYQSV
mmetsp:Transcript_4212/g.3672  ORF Transcript_4212/g.3672 Transcript_4212/m.3672 type:complete len:377 (+) Transcript_4212:127-1257(+)